MRVRLVVLLGVLVVALTVAVAPAAAAGTGGAVSEPGVATVLGPGQTVVADHWSSGDCGCGGLSMGMGSGLGGYPLSTGFGLWPWWAGMPLSTISATTGFTWPWAPWYYTPQWWTYVALSNLFGR